MELITKSKRPGMNCSIDVFYEETKGISAHINDRNTYKMMLVKSGSFVIEEDGGNRGIFDIIVITGLDVVENGQIVEKTDILECPGDT